VKYEELREKSAEILNQAVEELNIPLADEPTALECQMRDAEGFIGYLQYLLAWADYWLDVRERERLPEKKDGMTELDREKILTAAVAEERRIRNLIRNVIKALETRIQTCQSSLKFHQQSIIGGNI